jgi:hypothetical protein
VRGVNLGEDFRLIIAKLPHLLELEIDGPARNLKAASLCWCVVACTHVVHLARARNACNTCALSTLRHALKIGLRCDIHVVYSIACSFFRQQLALCSVVGVGAAPFICYLQHCGTTAHTFCYTCTYAYTHAHTHAYTHSPKLRRVSYQVSSRPMLEEGLGALTDMKELRQLELVIKNFMLCADQLRVIGVCMCMFVCGGFFVVCVCLSV